MKNQLSYMNILVLGDGKLASEIIKQTGWDYLSRKKDGVDVSDFDGWLHNMLPYDVIVNCIANTNTYSQDETSMVKINYVFPIHLLNFCEETGKKLVHISTDYVYSNSVKNASEIDVPVPDINWYSVTKLLADSHIKTFAKNYLICRLSHKPYPFPYNEAWDDVITNADYTPVISKLVIKLINNQASGLYNVGTEPKSIYELASQTKVVNNIKAPNHVPKNVTMNLSKLNNFLNNK
jgi:dTDP-4-dehydrorhamnose reductase